MRVFADSKGCTNTSFPMMDTVNSSYRLEDLTTSQSGIPKFKSFQSRFQFLSYILIVSTLIQNVELATAHVVMPVKRGFSQSEGSGTKGGHRRTAEQVQNMRDHDYWRNSRHRRALSTTVVDFPLDGNEYDVGLYYTEIGLGTPSKPYYVQVDTGSDVMWVNCVPCRDCPQSSELQIPVRLYDPGASTTSQNTSCSSVNCKSLANSLDETQCVDQSCYYGFAYGDGSTSIGYLVQDIMVYDTTDNGTMGNKSTTITFGCGFNQSGNSLLSSSQAVDGIMGLGRQVLSIVPQLADSGLTTDAFAHCLQGDTGEGGIFVIGEVTEPGLVYTPLIPKQYHYNVGLLGITIGTIDLNIPPSVFNVSGANSGTIFDSGTTLAFLADKAFTVFLDHLLTVVTAPSISESGGTCFEYDGSDLTSVFPTITLSFDGETSMLLQPTNYLYKQSGRTSTLWCMAWSSSGDAGLGDLTILGDIVLKNKLVVYDIGNDRIGWVDHDCTKSINVSNGTRSQQVNPNGIVHESRASLQLYNPVSLLMSSMLLAYAVIFL